MLYAMQYHGNLFVVRHQEAESKDREHIYYHFRDKAKATPDRVFLVFEGRKYTYRQLEIGKSKKCSLFTHH